MKADIPEDKKTRESKEDFAQDEKFNGCLREASRAVHREMERVKIRSDEDPDNFLYKKDRCRDRLNSANPKGGPLDRQHENITLVCLPPGVRQNLPDSL